MLAAAKCHLLSICYSKYRVNLFHISIQELSQHNPEILGLKMVWGCQSINQSFFKVAQEAQPLQKHKQSKLLHIASYNIFTAVKLLLLLLKSVEFDDDVEQIVKQIQKKSLKLETAQ